MEEGLSSPPSLLPGLNLLWTSHVKGWCFHPEANDAKFLHGGGSKIQKYGGLSINTIQIQLFKLLHVMKTPKGSLCGKKVLSHKPLETSMALGHQHHPCCLQH